MIKEMIEKRLKNPMCDVAHKSYMFANYLYEHIINNYKYIINGNKVHLYGTLYNICCNTMSLSKNIMLGICYNNNSYLNARTILENCTIYNIFTNNDVPEKVINCYINHYTVIEYKLDNIVNKNIDSEIEKKFTSEKKDL